jgi:hypothetical protein
VQHLAVMPETLHPKHFYKQRKLTKTYYFRANTIGKNELLSSIKSGCQK